MFETYVIAFTVLFFATQILYALLKKMLQKKKERKPLATKPDHKSFIENKPGIDLNLGEGSVYLNSLYDFKYRDLTRYLMALPLKDITTLLKQTQPQQKKYLLEILPLHKQVATKLKEISSEQQAELVPLEETNDQKALVSNHRAQQKSLQTPS